MNVEVDRLAHACGLTNAREFSRKHVRVVQSAGHSIPLESLYPYPGAAAGAEAANQAR